MILIDIRLTETRGLEVGIEVIEMIEVCIVPVVYDPGGQMNVCHKLVFNGQYMNTTAAVTADGAVMTRIAMR